MIDTYGIADKCGVCGAKGFVSQKGDGIVKCTDCDNMVQSDEKHPSMAAIEWNKEQRKILAV